MEKMDAATESLQVPAIIVRTMLAELETELKFVIKVLDDLVKNEGNRKK